MRFLLGSSSYQKPQEEVPTSWHPCAPSAGFALVQGLHYHQKFLKPKGLLITWKHKPFPTSLGARRQGAILTQKMLLSTASS